MRRLMIFECVACRVFAFVGMSGCLKNIQKHNVLERFLNIDHFAWTWDCLRNLIEDEAEIGLVCRLILEEMFDWFWIDFEVDLGSEIGPKWGRKSSWKVIEKRANDGVQDGLTGANMGSKMGSCWAENRKRLESKRSMEKCSEKKGDLVWQSKVPWVGGPP